MRLEAWHANEDKCRWKLVNTSNYVDIPGEIVSADEVTGECSIYINGETKTQCYGPGGIRIVAK